MSGQPSKQEHRWSIRKKGKHIFNMCERVLLYSGALLALMVSASSLALANPEGGAVVAGSADITNTPTELQINQSSDRALIEWNSFSIAAGETTHFIQPSASSITLNRVVNSAQLSTINGNLLANGHILVINPNGVLIGPHGNVDVAGFIASTANISNDSFMNSRSTFNFDQSGSANAIIENQGRITVGDAGLGLLVGPTVRNSGVIVGNMARIQLGAADTFGVDLYGDGLIQLAVIPSSGARKLLSENTGSLVADGGQVLMTAAAANSVVESVINTAGLVEAHGLVNRNGEIILTGAGATVNVAGTVDASGVNGGTIKIGGDYQGGGTLPHAANVNIVDTAAIKADAEDNGDGGTIVAWSDVATNARGSFSAQGGENGGNGGLIETSSKGVLDIESAIANTSAANGVMGDWLLDPANLIVSNSTNNITTTGSTNYAPDGTVTTSNIKASTVEKALKTTNVTITTGGDSHSGNGDITVANSIAPSSGSGSLTLTSVNDIFINASISLHGSGAFTANAARDVSIGSSGSVSSSTIKLEAGRNFLNASGSGALTGSWLIYSTTPSADTFDSLDSGNTAVWNTAGGAAVSASGNRYVFSYQPTITFTSGNLSKTYGDAVSLTSDYAVSGLQAGVSGAFLADSNSTAFSGTPTLTSVGAAASADVSGSPYSITVAHGTDTGLNGYAVAYNSSGLLTVNKAALTVTADNQSRVYGDANP
ncbi:MAG: filamentous hemagglutinin N-terminal domain-containing protein, partial [Proteobacteria bacterium]|nr:filamentous hemagglutinin N-terminal domain-containing protein [Pseudomonadota bacterium]